MKQLTYNEVIVVNILRPACEMIEYEANDTFEELDLDVYQEVLQASGGGSGSVMEINDKKLYFFAAKKPQLFSEHCGCLARWLCLIEIDFTLIGYGFLSAGLNLNSVISIEPIFPSLFAGGENDQISCLASLSFCIASLVFFIGFLVHDGGQGQKAARSAGTTYTASTAYNRNNEESRFYAWNYWGNVFFSAGALSSSLSSLLVIYYQKKKKSWIILVLNSLNSCAFFGRSLLYYLGALDGEKSLAPRPCHIYSCLYDQRLDFYMLATYTLNMSSGLEFLVYLCVILSSRFYASISIISAILGSFAAIFYILSALQKRSDEFEQSLDEEREGSTLLIGFKNV